MTANNSHVFVLVGKSGSGKTTLQYAMRHTFNIPRGVTTRAQRPGDIVGQYIYTDFDGIIKLAENNVAICINFVYKELYCMLLEDFNELHSVVVVDVIGLRQLQETFGFENVTGIYIEAPDNIRTERTEARQKHNAVSRAKADEIKFTNAYHLCDYKITNDGTIREAIDEFKSIVAEVLKEKGYV